MVPPKVVGIEMAIRDRESFDSWWPTHLAEVLELVDRLYLRVDNSTYDQVMRVLERFTAERDEEIRRGAREERWPADMITVDRQFTAYGRFQEDAEREALRDWAVETGAPWAVCFDADEIIEPGGGRALRALLTESTWAQTFRLVRVVLSYTSHHRPGYVLPRGGFMPWRAFRLDRMAAEYRWQADRDGLHCGSVPFPGIGSVTVPDLRVIHAHATSCAEYMAERAFYAGTSHVEAWGGIDHLYACGRFGDERMAVPVEQELAGAAERLARVAAGEGLIR